MKVLWICGLPLQVQQEAYQGQVLGAHAAWSWVLGHLPPPDGVELHIACPVTKGPWRQHPVVYRNASFHLVRCFRGRLQTGYILEPLFYRRVCKTINADIVHGWGTESSFGWVAQCLAPRRHAVQIQGVINHYLPYLGNQRGAHYIAWRERRTLKRAPVVFAESQVSCDLARPYLGGNTRSFIVDHPLRAEFLSAPHSDGAGKTILFLGAIQRAKGIMDAIQAFAAGAPPQWNMVIVGSGPDANIGSMKETIEATSAMQRFRWISSATVSTLVELMNNAAVFMLPSYMDTGPTALKEALAMGLWPICYDNTGPGELIRRFNFGSLVPTGDVAALGCTLSHVLETQPWLEPGRKEATVSSVRQALNPTTIWNDLLKHYSSIIANNPNP